MHFEYFLIDVNCGGICFKVGKKDRALLFPESATNIINAI